MCNAGIPVLKVPASVRGVGGEGYEVGWAGAGSPVWRVEASTSLFAFICPWPNGTALRQNCLMFARIYQARG